MISLKKSFVYKDLCYLMSLWSVKLPAWFSVVFDQMIRYVFSRVRFKNAEWIKIEV